MMDLSLFLSHNTKNETATTATNIVNFGRQKYWCITGGLTPGMRSHTVYFTYQQYETTTTTAV